MIYNAVSKAGIEVKEAAVVAEAATGAVVAVVADDMGETWAALREGDMGPVTYLLLSAFERLKLDLNSARIKLFSSVCKKILRFKFKLSVSTRLSWEAALSALEGMEEFVEVFWEELAE